MKNAFRMSMVVAVLIATTACNESSQRVAAASSLAMAAKPVTTAKPVKVETREERGRYLVNIMGCNDCHTPWKMGPNGPEPDMSRLLSGHPQEVGPMPPAPRMKGPWVWSAAGTNTAFAGPWGV